MRPKLNFAFLYTLSIIVCLLSSYPLYAFETKEGIPYPMSDISEFTELIYTSLPEDAEAQKPQCYIWHFKHRRNNPYIVCQVIYDNSSGKYTKISLFEGKKDDITAATGNEDDSLGADYPYVMHMEIPVLVGAPYMIDDKKIALGLKTKDEIILYKQAGNLLKEWIRIHPAQGKKLLSNQLLKKNHKKALKLSRK